MQNPLSFFGLYVSRAGNVGFPIGKRMAPPGETYGSVQGNLQSRPELYTKDKENRQTKDIHPPHVLTNRHHLSKLDFHIIFFRLFYTPYSYILSNFAQS